jgi:predicted  nucleic acid-binding Zn-ribbon protein
MAKPVKHSLASVKKLLYGASKIFSQDASSNRSTTEDIAMAGSKVEEKEMVSVAPEVKTLRHRRLYLKIRLPMLHQEIRDLTAEQKTLVERLKDTENVTPDERKDLRNRRIYVVQHRAALKTELALLAEERKNVSETLQSLRLK